MFNDLLNTSWLSLEVLLEKYTSLSDRTLWDILDYRYRVKERSFFLSSYFFFVLTSLWINRQISQVYWWPQPRFTRKNCSYYKVVTVLMEMLLSEQFNIEIFDPPFYRDGSCVIRYGQVCSLRRLVHRTNLFFMTRILETKYHPQQNCVVVSLLNVPFRSTIL